MSCEPIRMEDGTVVLANVKPGETLTELDKKILADWVQFCRDRAAKRSAKEQRKRNVKAAK
jgi:hypothetical protein